MSKGFPAPRRVSSRSEYGLGRSAESTLEVSDRSMGWVSSWATPIGVAQAPAISRTVTSGLDRLSGSASRGRADIRFVGSFMLALRLAPNASALL